MVKKAAQAIPNQLLRRARLERGWTQKVVAERIGAPNDMMVARWETGKAFPSPYYVERLCQLFEQKASDLGLLPDLQKQTVSQRLPSKASWPSALRDQARKDLSTTSSARQDALTTPLSYLPLIGREADMHLLRELYRAVEQGQMQAVLIQGEAGIGKTHLATTFLQWAATQGATLLQGRAFEMGGRLPYQPLVHALSRRFEQEPAPEALLSATWLSELSRILPELRDRYPSLPLLMGDETTARVRLFEAVTRLGQAFCQRGPVVLFIDDVQWADAASLDVLHYAGQRWSESSTPLLLLLSLRSEALATTDTLRKWLTGLHQGLPVTELSLVPLTLEETLNMLAALGTGHAMTIEQRGRFTEIGQRLFRETQGQPFYLVETLKMLFERQVLTIHHSPQGEELEVNMTALEAVQQPVLPPGVRRLILSRLEQLTTMGRALLMGSAILGQGVSFDVLWRVANLGEHDALAALEEVLRQGLLREISEEDGRRLRSSVESYIFGHDKIREVVYTEMGEVQRQLFHRRALTVLESLGRPAAELAHHALAAGLVERAWHFSLIAGDEAVRLLANAEAHLHYTQALEAISQLPDAEDTQRHRVEAILRLVQVSWMTAGVEHTLEWLAEAEERAQTLPGRRPLALVHYWTGLLSSMRNTTPQTLAYSQHVLEEAQELDDEELVALASVQLSRQLILQGRYDSIERLLPPAIPILEHRANWTDWTHALGFLGIARAGRGHYTAGLAQGQRALEHAQRAGDRKSRRSIGCHFYLSRIYQFGGDYLQMLSESSRVVEGAELLGDGIYLYLGYGMRAWAESRLGRHKEALESMEHAQAASQRLGGQLAFQDLFAAATAELFLAAGRIEEGLTRARSAVEIARAVSGNLSEGIAQRVWGQALAHLSRWEDAERHLKASVQVLLSGEILLEAARSQVAWGLLCRDRGDLTLAQGHFEQAAAQFETSGLTKELETVQSYLAQIGQS
jgi:transcriptional regulator with XRE-family HTH domain/tetratricopeptide (TPR) repeat protein